MTSNERPLDLLFALRPHLTLVHQVPGRVRLRIAPQARRVLAEWDDVASAVATLERLFGTGSVRLNAAAGSAVITHRPEHFPPAFWRDCLEGSEEQVCRWLAPYIPETDPAGGSPR